ncbi:WD40-repeat-containing domain protein [Crepidotus variabilis]|uniref:WD40-repeat-containing domain protein n=1 Tax=Crepidotus variabilis TaxID=179855 RepID=A0A9P6EBT9_9AGAR|nr:WD40-repeat-containing domain protein [Crepidotus variabilis]
MSSRPQKKVKVAVQGSKNDTQNVALKSSIPNTQKSIVTAKGKERETPADSDAPLRSPTKGKEREDNTRPPTSFKVVAGSYEKLLYGLDGIITIGENSKLSFELKPMFIFPAHVSCIKAVAASPQGGKWLATGSADEIIKVWDLRRRKEIGGLMHHEGSITHLVFPSRSHLLSASEDGSLCLFRARDWAVLRSLKGHKGHVNAVAVHPSGKVALSVGKDRALRMWDLMRGKGVASTKLDKEGEIVRWSSDGSKFGVQSGSNIQIYATNMDLLWTISHSSRIHDIKFVKLHDDDAEVLLVGAEDKMISVYRVPTESSKSPTILSRMVGHVNRYTTSSKSYLLSTYTL